jgi:hypothetical protein
VGNHLHAAPHSDRRRLTSRIPQMIQATCKMAAPGAIMPCTAAKPAWPLVKDLAAAPQPDSHHLTVP